jgi:phenylacetate-CoA ligase
LAFRPDFSWEFLSVDEIAAKSIRAMRNHVRHVKEVSAFYREALFDVFPEDIKTPEDIAGLPFTDKAMLVSQTPSFIAVGPDQIVETVITSGSTGKPLIFSMTETDLERLAFNEALSFCSAGVTPADRAQIYVSLDRLFIAGMAYYRGLTHLGVNTARVGVLPFEMQKHFLELLRPTVLVGVPSFLKKLARELDKLGFDKSASCVSKIFCIGESIRAQDLQLNATAKELESFFNAKVFSTYANTELAVAYCDCEAQNGGHAHPELVYTEIVDDNGKPVSDGEVGELVATPLGVEGIPLVRYKTGDITFKLPGECSCGRNSMRIGPILGRKSQMIKVKGTTVYPLSITGILDGIDGVDDYIITLEDDEALSDRVGLHVATLPVNLEKISSRIRAELRLNLPVLITNTTTLAHMRGKSSKKTRILDNRKHGAAAGLRQPAQS